MRQRFTANLNSLTEDQDSFNSSNGEFYKLTEGSHLLRILPPWGEEGKIYQKYGVHMPPGKANLSKKVVCTDFTYDQKGTCAICQTGDAELRTNGKEAAKPYSIKKRAYLNVMNMKTGDGKIQVLDAPSTVINKILSFLAEENSDDLVDLQIGYNVAIKRYKGKNGFTEYDVIVKPKAVDLAELGYDCDSILDSLVLLNNMVKNPSDAEVDECLALIQDGTPAGEEDFAGADTNDGFGPPARSANGARPPIRGAVRAAQPQGVDGDDPTPRQIRAQPARAAQPAAVARPVTTARPTANGAAPARTAVVATRPTVGANGAARAAARQPAASAPPKTGTLKPKSNIPAVLDDQAIEDEAAAQAAAQPRRTANATKVAPKTTRVAAPPPEPEYEEEQSTAEDEDFGGAQFNADEMPEFGEEGEEIPF